MFESILTENGWTIDTIVMSVGASLTFGMILSFVYMLNIDFNRHCAVILLLTPTISQVFIQLVNGNFGTTIALLGVISMIRFYSISQSTVEIYYIFFSVSIGAATGMGYVIFAMAVTILLCAAILLFSVSRFNEIEYNRKPSLLISDNESMSNENLATKTIPLSCVIMSSVFHRSNCKGGLHEKA